VPFVAARPLASCGAMFVLREFAPLTFQICSARQGYSGRTVGAHSVLFNCAARKFPEQRVAIPSPQRNSLTNFVDRVSVCGALSCSSTAQQLPPRSMPTYMSTAAVARCVEPR
jgi:hypothetical protein